MKNTNPLAKPAALIAVLVLGSSAWLSAQTTQAPIGQPAGSPAREQATSTAEPGATNQASQLMKINKGSSLIGTTVKNQQGEILGKIRDLVIDFSSEKVAYVVLDSGAGLLSAPKLHAVPLRAFQPDAEGTSLILNADKEKLASAAGFDKNNWPAMTTAAWGAEPFWKDAPATSSSPEAKDAEQQSIKAQQDKQYQEFKDAKVAPKKTEPQPQTPPQP
jgi:sporulation protein YlmC with PRC-barrel domain